MNYTELPQWSQHLLDIFFIQECLHRYRNEAVYVCGCMYTYTSESILEDLWAHLEKASQKPVADVMSTWTKQLGYPVISVEGKQVHVHTLSDSTHYLLHKQCRPYNCVFFLSLSVSRKVTIES